MNELIKYFEALESRLNALDARIAALERSMGSITPVMDELHQSSEALKGHMARIQEILDAGVQVTPDPDVEVELVYPEEEEATIELPEEESEEQVLSTEPTEQTEVAAEPLAEQAPVVAPEPQPVVEPETQPEGKPEPVAEPIVEQPVVEQPKPEAPRAPQQTSLFGTPVSDIRQAVSIGDRFLFQRELFLGNAEKLQQTLTELNGLHSLDEAVAFIDKFGWDKQSSTYELFLNVLRRRFQ